MFLVRLISTSLLLGGALLADSGSQPSPVDQGKDTVQVVLLAHTHAELVAASIKELGFTVACAPVAENRIILRGGAVEVARVVKEIVERVDVPEVSVGSTTVDYIQLSQRPPGSFEGLLEAVAPRDFDTHYAIDPASRLIAINAPKEKVAALRRLAEVMDRPTESFLIHFYFLRGKIGGGAAEKSRDTLPKDVAAVAGSLQAAGFGELSLVAPLIIQGVDGASFQSTVSQPRDGREEGDDLGIHVRGKPFADGTGSVVQLELDVQLTGRSVQKKDSGNVVTYPLLLAAESMITVKLDSCVVLAAAPTAGADGEAYAVVVKVTRGSAGKQ